jgi:hypothetical protein
MCFCLLHKPCILWLDSNSILSQQIVGEHKSAGINTCNLLIYTIHLFLRISVPKFIEGFSHYKWNGESPSAD